jgi:hypothetical protein
MRRRSSHALLAVLLVSGTLATAGDMATAQEADCARALWAVPIETVEMPDGWVWSSLTVQMDGGWSGSIGKPKADSQIASDFDDKTDDIYFDVECNADPQAFMEARSRARAAWPDRYSDIDAIEVGDLSMAFGYADGIAVDWAHGAVYGIVYGDDAVDPTAVRDFAQALDGLLP